MFVICEAPTSLQVREDTKNEYGNRSFIFEMPETTTIEKWKGVLRGCFWYVTGEF